MDYQPAAARQPYPSDHGSHIPVLIGLGLKVRIRRVLELGAGSFSTPLFTNREVFPELVELVSVETDPEWTAKIRELTPDPRITLSADLPVDYSRFDLIFVDSPEAAARVALIRHLLATDSMPAIMCVHDSENHLYRAEYAGQLHWDFTAFNPETAAVWKAQHEKSAELSRVMAEIDAVTKRWAESDPTDVAAWVERFRHPLPDAPPPRLTVSVSMAAYRRAQLLRNTFETYLFQTRLPDEIVVVEDGNDGGETEQVCRDYAAHLHVRYFCRRNRPDLPYSNSAIPRNIGIRQAVGDILVMQNPEVRFTKPTDFENIVGPTERDPMIATYAPCKALNPDGSFKQWYQDPNLWSYNYFCSAHRRAHLLAIGGLDETYKGYGFEDNSFNFRYLRVGVQQIWAKGVVTEHQWHEVRSGPRDLEFDKFNREYSVQEMEDVLSGRRSIEANQGKNWGDLNS